MATILLIEDIDDAAEPVVKALRNAGHRVMSVLNGREGLALLALHNMDLVVMDLLMPQMDGVTLLTVLRSYPRWQSLPVIVFSAYARGQIVEQLRGMRVAEVLMKGSTDLSDLVHAVERHLNPPTPQQTGT